MPARFRSPEPQHPNDATPAPQPKDRVPAPRLRRWLLPFLLVSLLIHLVTTVLVLRQPPAPVPTPPLDEATATSPREMAIQLEPNTPTSAAPPPTPPPQAATPPAPVPMPTPVQPPAPTPQPAPVQPPPPPVPPPPPMPVPDVPMPQPVEPVPTPMPLPVFRPPPPVPRPPVARPPVARPPVARPPAPRRPAQTPPNADFFIPPSRPAPSRQAGRTEHRPLVVGIGPAEKYTAAPPRRNSNDLDADIQVSGAQVGSDWQNLLHQWWIEHRRYPEEAAMRGEQGDVLIRFKVDRNGHSSGAQILSRSGSQWLDMQSMATWNNAHLPPFPFNTPEPEATITVSIHYYLVR